MMIETGDFMKMLFLSFWLTMARVRNVQLKTASFFQIMVAYFSTPILFTHGNVSVSVHISVYVFVLP